MLIRMEALQYQEDVVTKIDTSKSEEKGGHRDFFKKNP